MRDASTTAVPWREELSTARDDLAWDTFVEDHPWGQFQQSTLWARAKEAEGWGAIRLRWSEGAGPIGGVQVLTKTTRWGHAGFVNKGPLVHPDWIAGPGVAVEALAKAQRQHGWRVLVLQPPDLGAAWATSLLSGGFRREHLLNAIDSTLIIDLAAGWERIQAAFRRTVRRNLRQSRERGVTLHDGGEEDLLDFFRLMQATCSAQGVRPNPGSLEALRGLWRPFRERGLARLRFAVHQGIRTAGVLGLAYGSRFTLWKMGWNQAGTELHASLHLTADAIRWAAERDYETLDFVGLDRDLAEALRAGRDPGPGLSRRRDFFKLGFGGRACLLPPCMVRFRQPLLAMLYRTITAPACRQITRTLVRARGLA